ncbi:FecR domain-containing protein [Isoalcanivorax beigongshangi]|uniref:FecR domain-containing protein n=1 Tax=Isoalcanivorax beigongshangi TaxID=3238810 RepID=A0ABV4AEI0_9GAMM
MTSTPGPFAEGAPLPVEVAQAAADWLTLLMADVVSEDDRQRWQAWRNAHPDHERAWRHIEAITGHLQQLGPTPAYQVLSPYGEMQRRQQPSRRKVLSWLLLAGAAGGGALLATPASRPLRQRLSTDYRTGTGEQRNWTLPDGSQLLLNTDSIVVVDFQPQQRRLQLLQGELWLVTAAAQGVAGTLPPLVVDTVHGRIQALGTRFSVRHWPERTTVTVVESAVAVMPRDQSGPAQRVTAGQRTAFDRVGVRTRPRASSAAPAWVQGQLVADDWPLERFINELERYRPGYLRCHPAIATLRISGIFPLHDTDHILQTLPQVLPVRLSWRTRYWVSVLPSATD